MAQVPDYRDGRDKPGHDQWSCHEFCPCCQKCIMSSQAAELAHRLARSAEAVCRHYLSNGHREGRYWIVGNVSNTPGRSLYVRLFGPLYGKGAAGKWTDAATGQHGDLLDLIALSRGLDRLADVLAEARRFLGLAQPHQPRGPNHRTVYRTLRAGCW